MSRFYQFLEQFNEDTIAVRANSGDTPNARHISAVLHPPQNRDPQCAEQIFQIRNVWVEEAHPNPEARLVFPSDPRSPAADRFRLLRMRLCLLKSTGQLKSLLITSALPQDGKSTIALNVATVLAEGGKRSVLLIEADLRRPSLSQRLGLPIRPGLAEHLENGLDPVSALRLIEPMRWYLLPAGTCQGNPTELLQTDSFPRVLQKLSPYFDWILLDSPPAIPFTDSLLISQHTDASLMVVRAGHTPRESIEDALKLLGLKKVLGILLNGVEGLNELYAKYRYHDKKG
jgi:capsular exopolysaccharide synthesis family protein